MTAQQDLLLPAGSRLVHIGPHKTGTTTIQGAFYLARDRLHEHGVHYAARGGRAPMRAALAVTGQREMWGERSTGSHIWESLVKEVAGAGDRRVVVSTEFFADGGDEAAHRVVNELGGSRVHVVVTLRPLAKILPSQWQQYVQNGLRTPYDKWLDHIFNQPPYSHPTPTFWGRHRHDRLVERWAAAAGPDHVTVVVADESDPQMLLRTFESLVGLPSGLLVPEHRMANRSLTLGEAELVRLLNEEFTRQEIPKADYAKFVRYGAVLEMKTAHQPTPEEPRISTPTWALEKAAGLGAEMAAKISASGVRIVGDLSALHRAPNGSPSPTDHVPSPSTLSTSAATQAVMGAIKAGTRKETRSPAASRRSGVDDIDTKSLVRVLLGRVRRRGRRMLPGRSRS